MIKVLLVQKVKGLVKEIMNIMIRLYNVVCAVSK